MNPILETRSQGRYSFRAVDSRTHSVRREPWQRHGRSFWLLRLDQTDSLPSFAHPKTCLRIGHE
jgi:hypothetical protein